MAHIPTATFEGVWPIVAIGPGLCPLSDARGLESATADELVCHYWTSERDLRNTNKPAPAKTSATLINKNSVKESVMTRV
jgi:hypothetical protein